MLCAVKMFCAACMQHKTLPIKVNGSNRRFWHFWLNSFHSAEEGWFFTNYVVWRQTLTSCRSDTTVKFVKNEHSSAEWNKFSQKCQNLCCLPLTLMGDVLCSHFDIFSNDLCLNIIDSTKQHWSRWKLKTSKRIAAQNMFVA